MSSVFSVSQMADILHVSRSTVKCRLRHFNLSHDPLYSDMSDLALDENIKDLVAGNDKRGPEAVGSQLRALGAETQSEGQHASCRRGCIEGHTVMLDQTRFGTLMETTN